MRIPGSRRVRRLLVSGGTAVVLVGAVSLVPLEHGNALPEVAPIQLPAGLRNAREHATAMSWRTVRVGGVTRRYLLEVPPGPVGARGKRPLVVAYHGLWQAPGTFAAATGLAAAAAAEGVVLAVPDAVTGAFNDGRLGPNGPHDDAFFVALRAQLVRRGLVNPHRVTVAGFSNGAEMAMEIASRHPRLVAALVSVSGELLAAPGSARPSLPVTTVLIHGTRDRIQPWDGRRQWSRLLVAARSVPQTVGSFVAALGPHQAPSVAAVAGAELANGTPAVTVTTWRGGGRSVTFYTLTGFGHAWPVRHASAPGHHRGRITATSSIDATAITLSTALSAHTTPFRAEMPTVRATVLHPTRHPSERHRRVTSRTPPTVPAAPTAPIFPTA